MKIINCVLGDATGGRWKVFLDYAEVLRDLNHEVLLVVNSKKAPTDLKLPNGIKCLMVRNSGHYDILATVSAIKIITNFQPNAIICHCGRSVSLMKRSAFKRAPVIAVNHSNNVKRSIRADAYFNISTHIGKLIKEFPQAREQAFHIPNMVEIPVDCKWTPRDWEQPVRIGAFGRFDIVKGFHVFIEALALLKQQGIPFKAQLGGDGVERAALQRLIAEYNLNDDVLLPGWISAPQQFFLESDIFCIPALSDAFGITPLEAAIAGIPMVVSDAEGHQDMFVPGEHALFAPRGDSALLATALRELIGHPELARKLSLQAFERVTTEYGREKFSHLLSRALNQIAESVHS